MTKLTPKNWIPPYPSYISEITDSLHVSLTAVQSQKKSIATSAYNELSSLLKSSPDLIHSEHVSYTDDKDYHNEIIISYWKNQDAFKTWLFSQTNGYFTRSRKDEDPGTWIEAMSCSPQRFENSNSTKEINWGISCCHASREDPVHAYYGAMRDRIMAAENGGLAGSLSRLNCELDNDTKGKRLTISLPNNLCFIRTVQGWDDCDEEEKAFFLENSYPIYQKGVAFLNSNPVETNCISARLVNNLETGLHLPQTETLAWFLSLADLENWAWNHSTHKAIFRAALAHAEKFNFNIKTLLGHEVLIIEKDNMYVEYNNCHNQTGFLKVFTPTLVVCK